MKVRGLDSLSGRTFFCEVIHFKFFYDGVLLEVALFHF